MGDWAPAWPSAWRGPTGARPGTCDLWKKPGTKDTSCLSLGLQDWSASPSPHSSPPRLCPPTLLDSPSSLTGEWEGVGVFQNVPVDLQREAWQREIVSHLLDDQQPNNSGNGGGRGTLHRAAKRSSPQPAGILQLFITHVSWGPVGRQKTHQLVAKRKFNIQN